MPAVQQQQQNLDIRVWWRCGAPKTCLYDRFGAVRKPILSRGRYMALCPLSANWHDGICAPYVYRVPGYFNTNAATVLVKHRASYQCF